MPMSMRKQGEDHIGTCQVCFGKWKVDARHRRVALHGYTRPDDDKSPVGGSRRGGRVLLAADVADLYAADFQISSDR